MKSVTKIVTWCLRKMKVEMEKDKSYHICSMRLKRLLENMKNMGIYIFKRWFRYLKVKNNYL